MLLGGKSCECIFARALRYGKGNRRLGGQKWGGNEISKRAGRISIPSSFSLPRDLSPHAPNRKTFLTVVERARFNARRYVRVPLSGVAWIFKANDTAFGFTLTIRAGDLGNPETFPPHRPARGDGTCNPRMMRSKYLISIGAREVAFELHFLLRGVAVRAKSACNASFARLAYGRPETHSLQDHCPPVALDAVIIPLKREKL